MTYRAPDNRFSESRQNTKRGNDIELEKFDMKRMGSKYPRVPTNFMYKNAKIFPTKLRKSRLAKS